MTMELVRYLGIAVGVLLVAIVIGEYFTRPERFNDGLTDEETGDDCSPEDPSDSVE